MQAHCNNNCANPFVKGNVDKPKPPASGAQAPGNGGTGKGNPNKAAGPGLEGEERKERQRLSAAEKL